VGFAETVLLGAIAGSTIFLGLPIGRAERVDARLRVALAMLSVGILAFIFMDVSSHAEDIVSGALQGVKNHHESLGRVLWLFALLAAGFFAGTAGISMIERTVRRRTPAPPMAGGALEAAFNEQELAAMAVTDARKRALRTGMTIAVAIGLHNFAEGLAIGVSAKAGAIGLATVLIIGFGLHNATEGFGIVGPLGSTRPSWRWLLVAGLIGGGPTFVGTWVGHGFTSEAVSVVFLTLAAGSILYVVVQLLGIAAKARRSDLLAQGLLIGLLAGFITDAVVTFGGA
jgi:ZIP family zinc transporter